MVVVGVAAGWSGVQGCGGAAQGAGVQEGGVEEVAQVQAEIACIGAERCGGAVRRQAQLVGGDRGGGVRGVEDGGVLDQGGEVAGFGPGPVRWGRCGRCARPR